MRYVSVKCVEKKRLTAQIMLAVFCGCFCCGGTALAADAAASDGAAVPSAVQNTGNDLGETVVTAERIPSKKMETPANIAIITAKEIEANHYQTAEEALQHVNGVVVNTQSMGAQSLVHLNGDDRVVILVDGQRMNNDQGQTGRASADLSMLPSVKNIERIEVVKGGASAIYGSDAVGGVINIITKKGKESKTTLDMNTGSWGTHNYEITNEGSDGSLSWFLTGGVQKRGYFSYKADGSNHRMPGSDYNNNSFSLRLDDKLDDSSSVQLQFMHKSVDADSYYYSGGSFVQSYGQNELFNNLGISYNFKENQKAPGFVRYFDHYKSANFSGHYHTRLYGIDWQDGWQLDPNNQLIAGLEWHESKSSNTASGYEDKEITNKAVYLQDTMKLGSKWTFVPSVRMDHHNMFGTHWTPKAALNYRADQATQLYASWGRVYKAPNADDLYYVSTWSFPGYGSGGSYGNPNLQPETGHTESIGINHAFDSRTSISASLFNTELHDAIDWYTTDYANYYAANIAAEKKHGFELTFQKKVTPVWSYDAGYSYIHTETSDPNNSTVVAYINNNSQPNGYRLGIHYQKGAWKANLLGTMGSGLNERYYAGRSYAVWDFNVSYAVDKQTTMYFKINNFTNQAYSAYAGTKYPAPGRFFQVGVTYSF